MTNAQTAIQNLLRKKLLEAKRKNPRVSIRSFSTKAGVHFAALSSILNGERNVSRKLAERICTRLYLDPQERAEILALFPHEKKKSVGKVLTVGEDGTYRRLSTQQFKIVAEWEHFALLSLFQCHDFKSSKPWMAERLGVREARLEQILKSLIEVGVVSEASPGKYARSEFNFRTSDDVSDLSLKKCHEETTELAKESLYRDDVLDRDFTSVTVAIDPKKLSTAKERIRKFQDELCDELEAGTRTEVYRLSVQLFPLTKLRKGKKSRKQNSS